MSSWGAAITGVLVPAALMWFALRQRSLTIPAAVGASLVTAALAFLAGWEWAVGIDTYLLGLVAWVPFRSRTKSEALDRPDAHALLRAADVLAPLAWPVATAVANVVLGGASLSLAIYAGALASSSADLWATEVGVLSSNPPRDLVRGSPVSPGTVGAVSPGASVSSPWLPRPYCPSSMISPWMPSGVFCRWCVPSRGSQAPWPIACLAESPKLCTIALGATERPIVHDTTAAPLPKRCAGGAALPIRA